MELDDHGGRNHQLLENHLKLYPITRKIMGKDGLPVKTRNGKHKTVEVMAWKIVVKDMNHLASPALRPFRIPVHGVIGSTRVTRIRDGVKVIDREHTFHFGEDCCLTEDICPTIEQARNLGNIVCKMLNKYPHDLFKDVKEWDQMKGGCLKMSRVLIEVASLVYWNPRIDFASFPFDWCHHSTDHVGLYHSPLFGSDANSRIFAFYPNKDDRFRRALRMKPEDMDAPAIHEFLDKRMPDNFWFSGDWESDTLTEAGQACLRLKGYIVYATVGMCTDVDQMRKFVDDLRDRFLLQPKKSQSQALHYQNMYTTTTFTDTGHAVIDWSEQVYKKLSPTNLVRDLTATTGDSLLAAEFYEMDSSLHAWALEQGLVALKQFHDLLNAIQTVLSAADKVNTGQVSLERVKENYCHCNTEQLRRETYHVCMDCNDTYTCSTMRIDPMGQFLCRDCVLNSAFVEEGLFVDTRSLHGVAFATLDTQATLGVLFDEVIIRKRQRLLDAFLERGAVVNPSERPDFAGSFMFLQEDVDKPAAQGFGYVDAEDVFQGKATDDKIPQEQLPNTKPIILYFPAVPKRARVHRVEMNREDLFDEAHDDPNVIVNPRCIPQGLGTFTYLQPGELQLDEREARKLGLEDARATTDARIAAYLKTDSKTEYPFGEIPTVLWTAIEGSINPRFEPEGPGHWRYLTFDDAEKAHKSQGRKLTAAEYYDGQSWQKESKPARVVWVPLDPMVELVEKCNSLQQCLVECLEENAASAVAADPDSDPMDLIPNNSIELDSLMYRLEDVTKKLANLPSDTQSVAHPNMATSDVLLTMRDQAEVIARLRRGVRHISTISTVSHPPTPTELEQLRVDNAKLVGDNARHLETIDRYRKNERHASTASTVSNSDEQLLSDQQRIDELLREKEEFATAHEAQLVANEDALLKRFYAIIDQMTGEQAIAADATIAHDSTPIQVHQLRDQLEASRQENGRLKLALLRDQTFAEAVRRAQAKHDSRT
ncbi:hypothetical protein M438DRAFT_405445 [Aureobasidium pullulans EXF-150]|uniref:Uncharacterized protein n=1 Tax=Aureobasidium pullulans EXF-150 TaxID=1043002 RepID=A0A074XI32_AURPU|nr:uncharacterized protein M438DRAFT_405445 [Aureobasidium pullulans EXF-150]KEQ85153.1 hypothetical protein M438DRAFT_405445 [Aureobasidium pullulans EXF-150]